MRNRNYTNQKMATHVEAEVVVATTDHPSSVTEEEHPEGKEKGGLFRRFKKKNGDGEKSRKPPGNKWLQQQIPACRPVFTAKHVFAVLLVIGLIFIALGIMFLVLALRLQEIEVEYTNCESIDPGVWIGSCEDYLENEANLVNVLRVDRPECQCRINFTIPRPLRPDWYVYYSLHNYYQNHRRYLNSWDADQLRGRDIENTDAQCQPIQSAPKFIDGTNRSNGTRPVLPCGLVANSWFNDSFYNWNRTDSSDTNVTCCDRTNIAWRTDLDIRFQNPGGGDYFNESDGNGTVMPPFWLRDLANLAGINSTTDGINSTTNANFSSAGLHNESLIVWFRVSAFPWFRKLYGRLWVDGVLGGELPAGNYSVTLTYNYPVRAFNGRKFLLLSEVTWFGGRNLFLGSAYLVTGVIAVITGIILLLIHLLCSRWKKTDRNFMNREY